MRAEELSQNNSNVEMKFSASGLDKKVIDFTPCIQGEGCGQTHPTPTLTLC